jgi:hypothetical protein
MSDEPELSPSGAPLFDHPPAGGQQGDFESPSEYAVFGKALVEHVTRHVGPPAWVFHELVSDLIHVDVHIVEPTPERNFYILFTTGMSDRPMQTPEGAEAYRFAEMMICLPPDWKLGQEDFKDESNYWPVRWLKLLARFPHQYETWLWMGHSVPHGDPPEPFAPNTQLCCALLSHPVCFDDTFSIVPVDDDTRIYFLALIPLYPEEMEFKLRKGMQALGELMDEAGVTEILDISRPNVWDATSG